MKEEIEKEKWYTLQDIVTNGIFPWIKSFKAIRNLVLKDMKQSNILQPIIKNENKVRNKRYHFKGQNIINFIKAVETGEISL